MLGRGCALHAGAGLKFHAGLEGEPQGGPILVIIRWWSNSLLLRAWSWWERWAAWWLGSVLRDPWGLGLGGWLGQVLRDPGRWWLGRRLAAKGGPEGWALGIADGRLRDSGVGRAIVYALGPQVLHHLSEPVHHLLATYVC
jgi:hypothetical protein